MADAVLEALSDVFDDMTRQILNRKKEKAGAPQKLIQAVSLVVATTQRLENIALQLAKDEYEDWPQIFGEIEAAAKSVKEGGLLMGKATEALQKGDDSVAAWDEVGVSVGIMVQKTMLLLDIVYGSEVKVLNLISAQALSALEELDGKSAACSKDMSDDDVDNLIAVSSFFPSYFFDFRFFFFFFFFFFFLKGCVRYGKSHEASGRKVDAKSEF